MINEIVYLGVTGYADSEKPTLCLVKDILCETYKGYVQVSNGRVLVFDSYKLVNTQDGSSSNCFIYTGLGLTVEVFNVVRIRPAE